MPLKKTNLPRLRPVPVKTCFLLVVLPVLFVAAGCVTVDHTAPVEGKFVTASVVFKDFEVIGPVSVTSAEIHRAGPFGIKKSVEGSKVIFSDLLQEAARLEADDIIDARIDVHTGKKARFAKKLTGWERTFTYTGRALAIRYVSKTGDDLDAGFFRR